MRRAGNSAGAAAAGRAVAPPRPARWNADAAEQLCRSGGIREPGEGSSVEGSMSESVLQWRDAEAKKTGKKRADSCQKRLFWG
jgi:hypothetical protein